MSKRDFDAVWKRLADQGQCDGHGGMEYSRVLREWKGLGRPPMLEQFIVYRANAGPDGCGGEQNN